MSGMTDDELEMSEQISTLINQKNALLAALKAFPGHTDSAEVMIAWLDIRREAIAKAEAAS